MARPWISARTFPTILRLSVSTRTQKISTSRNDKDKISAGKPFTSADEEGLTLPMSFVKQYNEETGKKLRAKDFIGKEVSAQIVENTAEGTKSSRYQD